MAILLQKLGHLFHPSLALLSSVFEIAHLPKIVEVLARREAFFIVEPYIACEQVRVYVKDDDGAYLRDLLFLANKDDPWVLDHVLREDIFDWAKSNNMLAWDAVGKNYLFVCPMILKHYIAPIEKLNENEAYLLAWSNNAIDRGVTELRFYRPDYRFMKEDIVLVPDPEDGDTWVHSFTGTVIRSDHKNQTAVVADADGYRVTVELDRLRHEDLPAIGKDQAAINQNERNERR